MKRLSSKPLNRSVRPQFLESLESRQFLSGSQISAVSADNRGEVVITLNAAVNSATVNKNSVQAYTAGPDKILGNADDTRVPASVRYSASTRKITVEAQVTANDGYRVKLAADRLRDGAGTPIDGEFNGAGVVSGNGKAGGNFEFQTKNDKSSTPTVRLSTSAGVVLLKLFRSLKPGTTANFLSYTNAGDYDGIFWTRYATGNNGSPFVLQGGSLAVNASNSIITTPVDAAIPTEISTNGLISNNTYTVAFALSGSGNNSATNQFFINLANNSFLDTSNGGFTVFATVPDSNSQAVLQTIETKQAISITSPDMSTLTDTVPVNVSYNSQTGLNPSQDLVTFRRAAVVDKIAALS